MSAWTAGVGGPGNRTELAHLRLGGRGGGALSPRVCKGPLVHGGRMPSPCTGLPKACESITSAITPHCQPAWDGWDTPAHGEE